MRSRRDHARYGDERFATAALLVAISSAIAWGGVVYLSGRTDGVNEALAQSGIYGFPAIEVALGALMTSAAILLARSKRTLSMLVGIGSTLFAVVIAIGITF